MEAGSADPAGNRGHVFSAINAARGGRRMNRRFRLVFPALIVVLFSVVAVAQGGGELRFCLRSEPKTLNPLLVQDDASETIRYLTGGVLVRVNRLTQELEPELASAWRVSKDGRSVAFTLRDKIYFS